MDSEDPTPTSDLDFGRRARLTSPADDMTSATPTGEVYLRRPRSSPDLSRDQEERLSTHTVESTDDDLEQEVSCLRAEVQQLRNYVNHQTEIQNFGFGDREESNQRRFYRNLQTPVPQKNNNQQDRFQPPQPRELNPVNQAYRPTGPVKGHKPATYNGTSSWNDYLVHFDIVARLNQWDNSTKALQLAVSLRDNAQSVLSDLQPDKRCNFAELVKALAARFEPENQSELFRSHLKSRLRRRGEPLTELAQDVKRLTRKAYPAAPASVREQLARDCFLDALCDSDMEWAVLQGRPITVEAAVQLALEFEAFRSGRSKSGGRPQNIRMQYKLPGTSEENSTCGEGAVTQVVESTEVRELLCNLAGRLDQLEKKFSVRKDNGHRGAPGNGRRPGRCHNCGQGGHWKAECRVRKQARENRNPAYNHQSQNTASGNDQ